MGRWDQNLPHLNSVMSGSLKYDPDMTVVQFATECSALTPMNLWSYTEHEGTGNPEDDGSCVRVWVVTAPWGQAFSSIGGGKYSCGFTRSESGETIVMKTAMSVVSVERFRNEKNEIVARYVNHSLPFTLEFPTVVAFSTAQIVAYSEVFTLAAIARQEAVPMANLLGFVATIDLLTSVQWPFYLKSVQPAPTVTIPQFGSSGFALQSFTTPNECAFGSTGLCEKTWTMVLTDTNSRCHFGGQYSVTWELGCRSADCPLDARTNTATVTFELASSRHCADLVETIDLSLVAKSYEQQPFTPATEKNEFIDGQTAYVATQISAGTKATIVESQIHTVSLQVDGGEPFLLISAGSITPDGVAFAFERTDSVSKPWFRFRVDAVRMGVPPDSSSHVSIFIVGRARYAYENTFGEASATLPQLQTEDGSDSSAPRLRMLSARVRVSAINNQTLPGGPATASAAEPALIGAVAALGALVLLLAAALLVVLYRRRRGGDMNDNESVAKPLAAPVRSSSSAAIDLPPPVDGIAPKPQPEGAAATPSESEGDGSDEGRAANASTATSAPAQPGVLCDVRETAQLYGQLAERNSD
jgi:hypothetical protein